MRSVLCPGYFERDVQEIIELQGVDFCHYYCALCGQKAIPAKKDENGRWIPHSHTVKLSKDHVTTLNTYQMSY
jgi:hypothetical protein